MNCILILSHPQQEDPTLELHRRALITDAATRLDKAKMIRFDDTTGYLAATDLGRIASNFYIKYDTVEVYLECGDIHLILNRTLRELTAQWVACISAEPVTGVQFTVQACI